MSLAAKLTYNSWIKYVNTINFNRLKMSEWEPKWNSEPTPDTFSCLGSRVGYLVGTFSPITYAHIGLAKQALDNLSLDVVYFLPWPFYYIPGFHKEPLEPWISAKKHLSWEQRLFLINLALEDINDKRFRVLPETKCWYIESCCNYSHSEPRSAFWTGTWYVVRKLQWHIIKQIGERIDFWFLCGVDQFNPNIESLLDDNAAEQVWKDYDIIQHLAIHNIYSIPRTENNFNKIENFMPPFGFPHRIILDQPIPESTFCATHVRTQALASNLTLTDYVTPSVANIIKKSHLWGWT